MLRFLPLMFLAGVAAEIASIIWIGGALGVFPTLLLLLAGGVLGISLMKSAGTSLAETLRSPVQSASPMRSLGDLALGRVLSGLLFLIPGFFSDLLGVLLLLPPVRRWLRSRMRVETFSPETPPARRFDKMIEVEAVEITVEAEPRPKPGDRVV